MLVTDTRQFDQIAPQLSGRCHGRSLQCSGIGCAPDQHLHALARVEPRSDFGSGAVDRVEPFGKIAPLGQGSRIALPVFDQHLAAAALARTERMDPGKAGHQRIPVESGEFARDFQSHATTLAHQFAKFGNRQRPRHAPTAPRLQFGERFVRAEQAVARVGQPAGAKQGIAAFHSGHATWSAASNRRARSDEIAGISVAMRALGSVRSS